MSVVISLETGAAPQGGTESLTALNYANKTAFAAAAATAVSSAGGFVEVEVEAGANKEKLLLNVNRIKSVV